jgi:hypothetical protein
LEKGADLQIEDYDDHQAPREMAEFHGRYRILKLIDKYLKDKPSAVETDRF